jgi:hypothetical protein
MRFMMIVKSNADSEAGVLPDEKMLSAMGAYNESLIKAGIMLAGEGLQASAKGARVRYANGKFTVTDGPFAETKELVAGFWIIQVKSKDEAIELAKRVPFEDGEVELRQIWEMEELVGSAPKPAEWKEFEQGARAPVPARKPQTTRYMTLLKADRKTEAGVAPDEKLLAAMGALMDEVTKSGALLSGEGLQPSSKGAKIRYSGNKRTVIDGPFTEAKELVAGVSILQFKTKQEAVDFARRCLQIHVDWAQVGSGEMEIRPVFEIEDFPVDPAEKPDGWRKIETEFRDKTQG